MILDSSAIVAILLHQPDAESLLDAIAEADIVGVGAPTLLESAIVVAARLGAAARAVPLEFAREGDIEILPFGEHHLVCAIEAFERYGKGRHRAALNFGDCLAYATAYIADQPLLFVGNDFTLTDIRPAMHG